MGREFHRHQALFEAEREFEGTGPIVAWDASYDILGSDETGHLAIDWSIGGGVLFGDQMTAVTGTEIESFYDNPGGNSGVNWNAPDEVTATPVDIRRSDSVTVPLASASLGLSYDVGRIKVGAGYRWERYFDALDAGFDEAEQVDRTIDGPYFKLSVGFGGG